MALLVGACSWASAEDAIQAPVPAASTSASRAPAQAGPASEADAAASPAPAAGAAATNAGPRSESKSADVSAREGTSSEEKTTAPSPEPVPEKREAAAASKLGLNVTTDAPLQIDSRVIDILDAEGGGQRVRFSGGVKLTQGTLELTCATLDAYYPDGAGGQPQRIVAEGDVRVLQGDTELRCTRAEFDQSRCVTLCFSSESCGSEGWPAQPARLRRGNDWIEGRELQFDLCKETLSARCGARMQVRPKSDAGAAAPDAESEPQPKPESKSEPKAKSQPKLGPEPGAASEESP